MKIEKFEEKWFLDSKTFKDVTSKFSGGEVTIIGGSSLFHGAPIMALKACSRIASMVYFVSPKEDCGAVDKIKSEVQAFVWVPEDEVEGYVAKSEAVLIGPGMMRSHIKEHGFVCDDEGKVTREKAISLLKKFPEKKWIVDGGALQVLSANEIPKGSIVTPNSKEFEMLFGIKQPAMLAERIESICKIADEYKIVVLIKDEISLASDGETVVVIEGGSDGLVKGGVGDVTAGLALGFLAKDEPLLAISLASHLVKIAGKKLADQRGLMFSAQDLAEVIPLAYGELLSRL
jgi:ADP-dependent NAD(P)H-hydrate dehydratase